MSIDMKIDQKLKSVVAVNANPPVDPEEILDNTSFIELGYDSLQFIKLIVDVEEYLEIFIEDEFLDAKLFENYHYFEQVIHKITSAKNV